MIIQRQKRIYRSDLRANPNCVYVFGDNVERVGLGGQAKEMRGEPNAHGIATLWAPGRPFQMDDAEQALQIIEKDIRALLDRMPQVIVFPTHGVGNGLASMPIDLRMSLDGMILGHLGIKNHVTD